jgi:hypothetical protein
MQLVRDEGLPFTEKVKSIEAFSESGSTANVSMATTSESPSSN